VRFTIDSVADSTFTFHVGANSWVVRGQRGIAVDPRRNDVLVARFHVTDVTQGIATALITGQTTELSTAHVALLEPPRQRWFQAGAFWGGAMLGTLLGLALGGRF
jgi:hypothetical protein